MSYYRKGEDVVFNPDGDPIEGVITQRRGDMYTIIHGGVLGTSTRNKHLRAILGGTRYEVHKDKIMRKVR